MNDGRRTDRPMNFGFRTSPASDLERILGTPAIHELRHELHNSKGMTLVEVIAVLAIIGILAVVVLPKIDFGSTSSRHR